MPVVVRVQHGVEFHELPGARYEYQDRTGKYVVKTHRTFTEVLHTFHDLGGENKVLFLVDGVNNPRIALEYAKRARELSWGDDLLTVVFEGGRVKDFVRISCPNFFLDEVNPRNREDWPEIASACQVLYGRELANLDGLLVDYCLRFDESKKEDILRIREFARKYGDDLTNFVVDRKIEEVKRKAREHIGVECRI